MDENKEKNSNPLAPNNLIPKKKPLNGMAIVGYNILALAIYTLLLRLFTDTGSGLMLDAGFICIHFLVCVIMSIARERGIWLLSGFLILAIGFSTCVYGLGGGRII
jgi:hypothetical protein